ncbi:FecR family protein [Sphingobacterium sp. BN32]|uniref:FecR family protein n=1 Tax=Sphingobacterium sp. BN32 TaxID=3058432 RepID=UPI00265C8D29|nr:FecR domain-containing protein [Sphingobacterium sp. BN32]WKK58852.1 FecR domain-containing protein [Sphingobacterium sp. BN32]
MPKSDIQIAFDRYLAGHSTREDLQIILDSLQCDEDTTIKERIFQELATEETSPPLRIHQEILDRVLLNLDKKRAEELSLLGGDKSAPEKPESAEGLKSNIIKFLNPKKWFLVAACFLGLCFMISVLWNSTATDTNTSSAKKYDISLPSTNAATILFEDGEVLSLLNADSALLRSRGIEVIKKANKELQFKISAVSVAPNMKQTFRSPKGIVSHIILSDGSHVLLNSASQLSYSNTFTEKERRVSLKGEAYFQVSHNKQRPFIVNANETQINVLGTSFNVVTDEKRQQVVTTLEEGSVLVKTKQQQMHMTPGMRSASHLNNGKIDTAHVNIANEIAWKEGLFKFADEDIYSVMEKLQTWYDIEEIEITDKTTDRFSGTVKRTRKLSELFQNLEKISNYKFQIKDRRIIVSKGT